MPERTAVSYLVGVAVTFLGTVGLYNISQTAKLKEKFVQENSCNERRDSSQINTDLKYDIIVVEQRRLSIALEKQQDSLIAINNSISTTNTILEERERRRD